MASKRAFVGFQQQLVGPALPPPGNSPADPPPTSGSLPFWDAEVIPTFANYHLDAYAAWKRGGTQDVAAWRIAFRTEPERLNCTQMTWLGINGHVNNDLAFMIEQVGPASTYADHKHVDDVLVALGRGTPSYCGPCQPRRRVRWSRMKSGSTPGQGAWNPPLVPGAPVPAPSTLLRRPQTGGALVPLYLRAHASG